MPLIKFIHINPYISQANVTSHYENALALVHAYNARTEPITYFRIGIGWIPFERILTNTSMMQHPNHYTLLEIYIHFT